MLGIRVDALSEDAGRTQVAGWNEVEREQLRATRQSFRVSGEPMFNQSARFIGYRGIGIEIIAPK